MTDLVRRRALVAAIHETDTRLVLAVAGGGNAAITDLLDVPGASRTVLEIVVPYAEPSLAALLADAPDPDPAGPDVLGPDPAGAVSRATAEAMAAACLHRARRLADRPADAAASTVIGVACTAALVSDRPKRGEHRAHVAVADGDGVTHRRVGLTKGALDRIGEDRVVADALLVAIADACGVDRGLVATMEL